MYRNSEKNTKLVDCPEWTDRWSVVREVGGGSQGTGKVVRFTGDPNSPEFFVKLLNRNDDDERRARFCREASALNTYSHRGIPTLIETNAAHFRDKAYKLYLVTDFVPGPTLEDLISEKGALGLDEAVATTAALLDTTDYLHKQNAGHRDIKPANVILRNTDPSSPFLVDFGLVHASEDSTNHVTEDGQEIGNRFLRLPEFAPGSSTKRDPRSDITFVAGLFFYMITGRAPSVLEDEAGRLPHQRYKVQELLTAIPAYKRAPMVQFFDKAFRPWLSERFTTAADALTALNFVKSAQAGSDTDEAKLILERLDKERTSARVERLKLYSKAISAAENAITEVRDGIVKLDDGSFWRTGADGQRPRPTLRLVSIGMSSAFSNQKRFLPRFQIEITGDEVGVALVDSQAPSRREELGRAKINNPTFDSNFTKRTRLLFAKGLEKLSQQTEE